MKFFTGVTTFGLMLLLGMSSAQASPHHRHVHKHVVIERKAVVKPAPVRTAIVRVATAALRTLPVGHVRVVHGGRSYFVHDGVYYVKEPRGYVVVRPVGSIRLASLPRGYVSVRVGPDTLYRYNDVYYRRTNGVFIVV
ncbi:MAG: hypothetical protein QGG02_08825 [Gammaproteobacteria bacterium]|jgi:hypothetical protein|nr:hypothetical protein [Gammaproteobacteria bacterium]MDP6731653.1 hypothetical protein [Gammaproteobacteria bacterium]